VFKRTRTTILRVLAGIVPERILLIIRDHIFSDPVLDGLFKQYRPALTIVSWGGVYSPCPMVLRSAEKFGSLTISVDASWDCMDEVSVIPKVNRLLVWNEPMKEEAIAKHGYDQRHVSVSGPLRCDAYRSPESVVPRSACFEMLGLDAGRKLITLAINRGTPDVYCGVVKSLLLEDEEDRLAHPIQVYVRLAPWSRPEAFSEIASHPLVKIGKSYSFETASMVQEEEIALTVNLLCHTDVLITVLSTLILESSYFSIPNISLRFPEFRALYERDFIAPLYETGGVTFVDDMLSLITAVNQYLADPGLHAKGRQTILQRLCHGGEGMVKERVLAEIDRLLGA
jgi:hypothetical protein